jgi:glycosyltransferase involved in cell wall biosynthesis
VTDRHDADPDGVRISLVVPARNEEAYLPALLDSVETARARYARGPSAVEVIVSDNASTDRTAEIARERGCVVAREERRIIAAVRNRGATAARGEILAFTDADNTIHPDTFDAIERTLTDRVVAGATGARTDRLSPGIAAAYAILVPMVWLTGMDTGVVFCRRADFEEIGGYNEGRLFAEDVNLLWDLRRLGMKRRQKLARATEVKVTTSTRKFDRFGEWHYPLLVGRFFVSLLVPGDRMERTARRYWYDCREGEGEGGDRREAASEGASRS